MRANKWRGTEIARHGYSTRFGAGGSIDRRRGEANRAGRLGAGAVRSVMRGVNIGNRRSVPPVQGRGLCFKSLMVRMSSSQEPLRAFARQVLKRAAIFQIRSLRFNFLMLRMSLSQNRCALLRDRL